MWVATMGREHNTDRETGRIYVTEYKPEEKDR
jgi:hypothetical protein